jgi:hypothetical protein
MVLRVRQTQSGSNTVENGIKSWITNFLLQRLDTLRRRDGPESIAARDRQNDRAHP